MFGWLNSNKKEETVPEKPHTIKGIKENKYFMHCIQNCYQNYMDYLTEEEKVCLAQCNDNLDVVLRNNAKDLLQLRSSIN